MKSLSFGDRGARRVGVRVAPSPPAGLFRGVGQKKIVKAKEEIRARQEERVRCRHIFSFAVGETGRGNLLHTERRDKGVTNLHASRRLLPGGVPRLEYLVLPAEVLIPLLQLERHSHGLPRGLPQGPLQGLPQGPPQGHTRTQANRIRRQ